VAITDLIAIENVSSVCVILVIPLLAAFICGERLIENPLPWSIGGEVDSV